MSPHTPDGLLHKFWFYATLYWCRRGCEGQRSLRRESFKFQKDADGNDFITMSHDQATKNHQGGFYEIHVSACIFMYSLVHNQAESEARSFLPKAQVGCQIRVFRCSVVWKQATWCQPTFKDHGEISLGANLWKTYTNHCVRATDITLWSDSCIPARHIMNISGHVNELTLASYNRRPSTSQLKNCSDILSTALENGRAPVPNVITQLPAGPYTAWTSSVSLMASNLPLGGIFNSCHIGQAQVFMLPQNGSAFSNQ